MTRPAPHRQPACGTGTLLTAPLLAFIILFQPAAGSFAGTHRHKEIHCRHFFYGYPAGAPFSSDLIIRDSYALSSNDTTKFADWVAYRIEPGEPHCAPGATRRWLPDPWLEEDETLEPDDYRGAHGSLGIDRGHMAPFGSISGVKNRKESNYLSNILPQGSRLNRGLWKRLEERERSIARSGLAVYVMAGPLYERPMPALPGADEEHRVPSGFWKIIAVRDDGSGRIRVAGFIFDQTTKRGKLTRSLRTVGEIERRSGLDFFWLLPAGEEKRIEGSIDRAWAERRFR